ncbi:MAG: endonuclease [Thermodesulfovibrio sp.]|nr:endonuclease [Thermodesulfovibrio sp.]
MRAVSAGAYTRREPLTLSPSSPASARRLGVHASIAGGIDKGLERAAALGCNTLQFFSHNPRGWAIKDRDSAECAEFRRLRKDLDIVPAFIHTSYLINLAAVDRGLLKKSVAMVVEELHIADALGVEYVVLHTGSASADIPEQARKRAIEALTEVAGAGRWKAGLLLENTAGERGDTTSRLAEIAEIIDAVPRGLIAGVCIDTCHAFAAGYELRTLSGIDSLAAEIDRYVGRKSLRLVHLNDTKGEVGSHLDRHEHIGDGKLGLEAIRYIVNHPFFADVPLILETPKKTEDDDRKNLARVKELFSTLP